MTVPKKTAPNSLIVEVMKNCADTAPSVRRQSSLANCRLELRSDSEDRSAPPGMQLSKDSSPENRFTYSIWLFDESLYPRKSRSWYAMSRESKKMFPNISTNPIQLLPWSATLDVMFPFMKDAVPSPTRTLRSSAKSRRKHSGFNVNSFCEEICTEIFPSSKAKY